MKNISIYESCKIFDIQPIKKLETLSDFDIRKIYHKLCLRYHPDKNTNSDSEHFIKVREAYSTILEYRKHKIYESKQNQDIHETSEQRIYKFLVDIFNDNTLNNIIDIFENFIDKKQHTSKHIPTITYHISINQAMKKEVFFHESYKIYIPLWHKVLSLHDFENYSKDIKNNDNVIFVMKIKEDDNKYMKVLENNDIIVYKNIDNICIDQEVIMTIGDKCIKFKYTTEISSKKYHILLNEGIPRMNKDNIYDFGDLSNVIICFV